MLQPTAKMLGFLLLVVSPAVRADVYEWRDAQGRHHYSDRTQHNAKILPVKTADRYYVVKKVYDGDTILLGDGRKVRFLGVNTPEVAGRNKNAEAGGEAAKTWLTNRLQHQTVRLEFDVEKQDKYQRTLAHVFTKDKLHVNLELVRRGLAAVNIYPPNLKYVQPLLIAQQEAAREKLGIWRDPAYAVQSFELINDSNYKGWKRLSGRFKALRKSRKYSYLQFSPQFSIRIENAALDLFPDLQNYLDKSVEVRGWLSKSNGRFVMHIRHPADLQFL